MRGDPISTILIPNTYVRLLAQEFEDHATLATGTGIAPEDLAAYPHPISVKQHLRCISNALPLRTTPDWHLKWGKRMAENFHGAVTQAWLTAPTLGDGLDTFIKYMPSRIPYLDWRGRRDGGSFRCELTPLMKLGAVQQMLIEIPIIVMHEYVRVVRNGPATAAHIEFTHAAPAYRARYAAWFDCPVDFARDGNALVIPAAWRKVVMSISMKAPGTPRWRAVKQRCGPVARPTPRPASADYWKTCSRSPRSPPCPRLRMWLNVYISRRVRSFGACVPRAPPTRRCWTLP